MYFSSRHVEIQPHLGPRGGKRMSRPDFPLHIGTTRAPHQVWAYLNLVLETSLRNN